MIIDKIKIPVNELPAFEEAVNSMNEKEKFSYYDKDLKLKGNPNDFHYMVTLHYATPSVLFEIGKAFGLNIAILKLGRQMNENQIAR